MNKLFLKRSSQKGFTLVEMIVSLGIFMVVAVIAVGSLLKILDANRKSINLKTAINNLNFSLESMSREMRTGSDYYLTENTNDSIDQSYVVPSGVVSIPASTAEWLLVFKSSKTYTDPSSLQKCNLIFAYRLHNLLNPVRTTIQKAQQTKCSDIIVSDDSQDADYVHFQDLTAVDVTILKSSVVVDNTNQPKVFMWFKGSTGVKEKDKTEFSIQTTVSQRISVGA